VISVSVKVVVKIKTHILCSTTFPYNPTICEIILKNIIEQDMRIASWITKARNTIVIIIRHELGLDRPVSASSNCLFQRPSKLSSSIWSTIQN